MIYEVLCLRTVPSCGYESTTMERQVEERLLQVGCAARELLSLVAEDELFHSRGASYYNCYVIASSSTICISSSRSYYQYPSRTTCRRIEHEFNKKVQRLRCGPEVGVELNPCARCLPHPPQRHFEKLQPGSARVARTGPLKSAEAPCPVFILVRSSRPDGALKRVPLEPGGEAGRGGQWEPRYGGVTKPVLTLAAIIGVVRRGDGWVVGVFTLK